MADLIRELRDIVPIRPLTSVEALHIAERQTFRLLELAGLDQPPFPESVIAALPRLHLQRVFPFPESGATKWLRGRWLIIVNGGESRGRQRFSLAHEFKHVLDHPFIKVLYPPLGNFSSYQRAEAICNYFAGCLLMPRPWIKRAWQTGKQDIPRMAHRFDVSQQAMQVRLQQIGLVEPSSRRHLIAA